jgi:Protein of unknown function (DUF3987)
MEKSKLKQTARNLVKEHAESVVNSGFMPAGLHPYYDENRELAYFKIRLKHPDGRKWIRPFHFCHHENKYVMREPNFENNKPLYNLPELKKRPNEPVFVFEGEVCSEKASKLNLLCTTSGSATSAKQTDWTWLANREIYIWPDNNSAGFIYAEEVRQILLALECDIKIINIEKLDIPEGGDIVDWLEKNPDTTKESILCLPIINPTIQPNIASSDKSEKWPDPEPIQNELLPVQSLPVDIIPTPFRDFIIDEAERMQCPIDYIAVTLIVITSSIVGASCGIKPKKEDDWSVIPNLWGGIIGSPGKLKTPAVTAVISFLDQLESDEKKKFDEAMKNYETDFAIFKAEKNSILSTIASSSKRKNSVSETDRLKSEQLKESYRILQEPQKPKRKRFKSNDATIEKLSELLSENPNGMLLYRDELMGLLTSWDKSGHESDRAFYLEAWNGKGSHTTDRILRGTIDTENMCLSIFGTTQPDKLIRYLTGALHGNNDGLIQRFQLLIYPDNPSWKLIDRKPDYNARKKVQNIIHNLVYAKNSIDIENNLYNSNFDDLEQKQIPLFHFDEESQNAFYEWLTDLELNKMLNEDDHHLLIEHLSKYRKLMPALALLFHLIDLADGINNTAISIKNTMMACAWCEYLESHARRIYALVTDIDSYAASVLSNKIQNNKLESGFTVRDVYRLKGLLKEREIAQAACDELVAAGWLRESHIPPAKGQKGTTIYHINPKVRKDKNE